MRVPDDPAERLVYADALLAGGDPRGELITIESQPATPERLARRVALRAEHAVAWWGLPARFVRTRGGAVDAIAIRPDQLAIAHAIAAREPLQEIEIYGGTVDVAALPPVPRLVLHEATNEMLDTLLASPLAETLTSLDLGGAPIEDLAPGSRLPRCERLAISRCWIGLQGLVAWEHVGRLRELAVVGCDLWVHELCELLAVTGDLAVLRASSNDLHSDTEMLADAIAGCPRLARVELANSKAQWPSAVHARGVLDLVGHELAIGLDGSLAVDGIPHAVAIAFSESTSIATGGTRPARPEDLELLVEACSAGWPRTLTDAGCSLVADFLPRDHRLTATVALGDPVAIDAEYYID